MLGTQNQREEREKERDHTFLFELRKHFFKRCNTEHFAPTITCAKSSIEAIE